jgi:DNA-binding beta-propeller fold protein YncE
VSAPPVASGTSTPLPRASTAVDEPPAGLVAARRTARGLFIEATLEADHTKARELFLQAAEALPPGGPSLYQAGRMAALDGDTEEARRLFDRAIAALTRSTHVGPRLTAPLGAPLGYLGDVVGLAAGASGRFLLVRTSGWHGGGTAVYDTFGFGLRFASEVSGDASALSNDGTLVVATGRRLMACSLVEASCAGAETLAKVVELALSTDGGTVAARMEDGTVDVRDATTLAVRATFSAPLALASAVAWSPAGDQLFVGLSGGAVLRVRADNGQVVGERRGHTAPIVALALDPSGEVLASADARKVRVGKPGDAQGEVVSDHDETIHGLAFSPDGKALFIERDGVHEARVDIWSVATRTTRSTTHETNNYRIAPAPGRLYLASGYSNAVVEAYEMPDPERFDFKSSKQMRDRDGMAPNEKWLRGRKYPAEVLAAGGKVGVADGYECETPLWDVDRGVFLRTVSAKNGSVFRGDAGQVFFGVGKCDRARLTPDGEVLAHQREPMPPGAPKVAVVAVEAAGTLAWVDAAAAVRVGPRAGPFREIGKQYRWGDKSRDPNPRIALSPKGALVGFRTGADRAEIWEIGGDRPAHVVKRAGISGIVFGADETAFVSALDGSITMVRAGEERTLLAPDGAALIGLALLRGGRLLAAAADDDYDPTVYVYSTEDGVLRATLTALGGLPMRRPSGAFLLGLDGHVIHTPSGAFATSPSGPGEVFGPIKDRLGCRFGPFVFGLDLCHDRLVKPGLLARMLSGKRIDP